MYCCTLGTLCQSQTGLYYYRGIFENVDAHQCSPHRIEKMVVLLGFGQGILQSELSSQNVFPVSQYTHSELASLFWLRLHFYSITKIFGRICFLNYKKL